MQTFKRRRIIIKTMEEKEVEDYYNQFPMDEEEKARKIKLTKKIVSRCKFSNPNNSMLIFVVRATKGNKFIGTIVTQTIGVGKISVQISIPREENEWSYGVEILDQFRKVCKEEAFFDSIKFIKLDIKDDIVKKYMEGKKDISSAYIKVS